METQGCSHLETLITCVPTCMSRREPLPPGQKPSPAWPCTSTQTPLTSKYPRSSEDSEAGLEMLEGWPPSPAYVPPCPWSAGPPVGRGQWLGLVPGSLRWATRALCRIWVGEALHVNPLAPSLTFTAWPGAELWPRGSRRVSPGVATLPMPTESSVWWGGAAWRRWDQE